MKGYKHRHHHNSGRAQRIAANKERKRQEREELRKTAIAEAKETIQFTNKYPRATFNWYGLEVPASFVKSVKSIVQEYLKDNEEEV